VSAFRAKHSSQRTECAARLLSGVSLVRCQGEEPFHKRSASGWSRTLICHQSHQQGCPRFTCTARQRPPTSAFCRPLERQSLALRQFIRPIVQKENGRLASGRPWRVTTPGDHFHSSVAQKQSPRPISERPRRDTERSHQFRVIGVKASTAVF
jgi:hypothetical protein